VIGRECQGRQAVCESLADAKFSEISRAASLRKRWSHKPWMNKTKVIIAGGGFAGLYAAMHLDKWLAGRADVEVTLIRVMTVRNLCRQILWRSQPANLEITSRTRI